MCVTGPQFTCMVRYVLKTLDRARADRRPVPWVLLENVEALLDRTKGNDPAIRAIVDCLEQIGYKSWAHRVICSAGRYLNAGRCKSVRQIGTRLKALTCHDASSSHCCLIVQPATCQDDTYLRKEVNC